MPELTKYGDLSVLLYYLAFAQLFYAVGKKLVLDF